jgi:pyruvate dehydrogenase E2 component (dihydrolipoamide acetyltransferase)
MAVSVIMPKLEMAQETSTVVEWLKQEGDHVEQGEPLLTVETDKATVEIESPASGILAGIRVEPEQVVPVTEVIAYILQPGEELPLELTKEVESVSPPLPPAPAPPAIRATPVARQMAEDRGVDLSTIVGTGPGGRVTKTDVEAALSAPSGLAAEVPHEKVRATPAARRMAREREVDLSAVTGSGPRGRIQAADVLTFTPAPMIVSEPVAKVVPLKGLRRIIAERMAASVHTAARVTLVTEADATAFVEARERLKATVADEWGFAPGYNDLLGIIVARALREFPYMNARLSADGQAIERLPVVNLGMAVDTERGLLVLVIRDADQKGLRTFGTEFRALVERARVGKATPEDLTGGTFTVTNLGMHEIDAFTPIINLPEAAILGVGRIQPKPVVREGEIVVRQMWTLSLVFDHRVVDGAPAARFLQRIKQLVENPYLLLG